MIMTPSLRIGECSMLRTGLHHCQTGIAASLILRMFYPEHALGWPTIPQGESMADIPRLNGVIRALEAGKPAFTSFCQADPETATAMSSAKYDGVVYEMEHNPWDIRALRDR